MQLTAAGDRLRGRAGAILRQVEETRADLAEAAGAVRGKVVFGLPPTVGAVLTARLVERFLAAHPEATLRVVQGFSGYLLDWLQGGELDLAVVYAGGQGAGVRQTPLLTEGLCFVGPPGPGLAPHQAIGFAEAMRERLVLPGPAHGLRRLVEAEAAQRGLALRIAVEADDLSVLKALAMRRLGGTVLPLAAVREEVAAGLLGAAPIIDPPLTRKLAVAEPLGRHPSNAATAFARLLRAEVAGMVEAGIWSGQLLRGDRNPA
nr:LysR substrate-binding domain-containing protein [Paracraurococcus ruber]